MAWSQNIDIQDVHEKIKRLKKKELQKLFRLFDLEYSDKESLKKHRDRFRRWLLLAGESGTYPEKHEKRKHRVVVAYDAIDTIKVEKELEFSKWREEVQSHDEELLLDLKNKLVRFIQEEVVELVKKLGAKWNETLLYWFLPTFLCQSFQVSSETATLLLDKLKMNGLFVPSKENLEYLDEFVYLRKKETLELGTRNELTGKELLDILRKREEFLNNPAFHVELISFLKSPAIYFLCVEWLVYLGFYTRINSQETPQDFWSEEGVDKFFDTILEQCIELTIHLGLFDEPFKDDPLLHLEQFAERFQDHIGGHIPFHPWYLE